MKGSASLFVNETKLAKLIPEARKRYSEEIETKKGELYFNQENEVDVEISELTNDMMSFDIKTPFGELYVYLTPDRKFLAEVADIAIERTKKAIAILNNDEQ